MQVNTKLRPRCHSSWPSFKIGKEQGEKTVIKKLKLKSAVFSALLSPWYGRIVFIVVFALNYVRNITMELQGSNLKSSQVIFF